MYVSTISMIAGSTGHQRNIHKESYRLVLIRKCVSLQFLDHCHTGHQRIGLTSTVPPIWCTVSPSDHFRFCTHFIVEARDGRLDVYPWTTIFFHLPEPKRIGN